MTKLEQQKSEAREKLDKLEAVILSRTAPLFLDGTKILLADYKATAVNAGLERVVEVVEGKKPTKVQKVLGDLQGTEKEYRKINRVLDDIITLLQAEVNKDN